VIEGFGKQELHAFVLGAVAPQTQLVTDDWPSYHNPDGRTRRLKRRVGGFESAR
jgi:hypothetical protein